MAIKLEGKCGRQFDISTLDQLKTLIKLSDAVLLANPASNAWEFTQRMQDYIVTKYNFEIPLVELRLKEFKTHEFEPCINGNVRKKDVYYVHDSTIDPSRWISEVLFAEDAINRASAESVNLVLPDLDWSRQDRKEKPHVSISARALADAISPGANRIITMDPHTDQIQGFYPARVKLDSLKSFPVVVKYIVDNHIVPLENLVVIATDGGDIERASEFNQALGFNQPIAALYKERDLETKKIQKIWYIGEELNGKDALLIDDITDSGGTNLKGGMVLREHGANRIYSFTTHGIYTEGTKCLTDFFNQVITTDTRNKKHGGITTISVSPVFAEAIYRAQVGESISSLFQLQNNHFHEE
jgi:ribose-phosphate pyrophosphokinase